MKRLLSVMIYSDTVSCLMFTLQKYDDKLPFRGTYLFLFTIFVKY